MGLLGLFGVKAKRELSNVQQDIIGLMAKWDWGSVSEYELTQREKVLDQVTEKMVEAKRVYEREQHEYEVITGLYNDKLADAEKINEQITSPSIPLDRKSKFEDHLNKLLAEIESMKPDVDREEQEAVDAKEHFELLKEAVDTAAKSLATAKTTMQEKKRQLDRLEIEEDRAKQRENDKLILLGIKQKTDSMGSITSAIDNEIQKRQDTIAASKAKTDALDRNMKSSLPSSETTDPEILAALGKNTGAQPSLSAADRLASLKRK